jgi:glutamyl-tRNA(Gln) amidotransferase subunit E
MDYVALGLKVGLEWHQRLNTHKLFCNCPSQVGTFPTKMNVRRRIRASMSELGEFDPAVLVEHVRSRNFTYELNPESACLVELDETPPAPFNTEAVSICLEIALLFKMKPVDEIRCMRKTVIDGSNTTGFQRTMLVAVGTPDSVVETDGGTVGLKTLCLEEESAFIVETGAERAEYRLDRLGIPLVEIATLPQIRIPGQAREVAERVGAVMRSTGKVQRGLGTIRQDINVSIREGARQEIKGVQELDLIPLVVEREVERQVSLLNVGTELRSRGAGVDTDCIVDVSGIFSSTGSKVLKSSLEKQQRVMAARVRGFSGLLGQQVQPGRRFGSELADYARVWGGVDGLFHSDELPGYGVTGEEAAAVSRALGAGAGDGFIIVAGPPTRARAALKGVLWRAALAIKGIPEETRRAMPNGNTAYMRPLPGAARMYPETDVSPFVVTVGLIEGIAASLPPLPEERVEALVSKDGLSRHLAEQLVNAPAFSLYEVIVSNCSADRTMIASVLLNTIPFMRREGLNVENLDEAKLILVFRQVVDASLTKEEVERVLSSLCEEPGLGVSPVVEAVRSRRLSEDELREHVRRVIEEHASLIREKGNESLKPLMGVIMKELKGKASGSVIHRILTEEISGKSRGD